MRSLGLGLLALVFVVPLLAAHPVAAQGKSGEDHGQSGQDHGNSHGLQGQEGPCDDASVAAVRAEAAEECDCASAKSHGQYVACTMKVVNRAVRENRLAASCRNLVLTCAAKSTCGKEGAVTCCRTDKFGRTRCSVKRDPSQCQAPPDGSACVGSVPSCCEACNGPNCGGGTTTTTITPVTTSTTGTTETTTTITVTTTSSSSSSTSLPTPSCGNEVIDTGEQCDPPGSPTCPPASPGGAMLDCLADCTCPGGVATTTTTTPPTTSTSATIPATTTTSAPPPPTTTTSTTAPPTTTTSTTAPPTTTTSTPPPPTTTTSIVVTTTTSSTTTTTMATLCCGVGPTRLSFTTSIGTGNCGTVQTSTGTVSKNLACSGLFTGGGGNTVPLPYSVPDQGTSLTGVTSCTLATGDLTLTNLTSANTGSNRNCTSVGCLFGPPLPIPNAGSTPTSVCVVNVVATNAAGTANCNTGTTHLNLPLSSVLYLDGDLFPAAPGIQVCPVCNKTCNAGTNLNGPCNVDADCPGGSAGSCAGTDKCHGGPNDGNACMPADTATLGTTNSFPTSHDCPPPPANNIGALPIAFDLVTGTKMQTATNNTASGQNNVFCGFCRDLNNLGTGCFEGDPNPACPVPGGSPVACTSNANCNANYPDCVQRSAGAFGPAGGGARTITVTGSPAGDLTDGAAHASTLASVFCIQPTFNSTVDAAGDLPGPGAVTLSGTAQLLP